MSESRQKCGGLHYNIEYTFDRFEMFSQINK